MSGPREIITALGRGGAAGAIIEHLAEHGPSSAGDLRDALGLSEAGARTQLLAVKAGGLVDLEDDGVRVMFGACRLRYFLNPDALHYAARWLDVLAERAEKANRYLPLPGGRTR